MKKLILLAVIASALFSSCQKNNNPAPDAKNAPGGISAKNLAGITTDVYVAGYVASGSRMIPAYWKNGLLTILPSNPLFSGSAGSIAVHGTDIYAAGTDNNTVCYWKNGVEHVFPQPNPNSPVSGASGIAVSASGDVYIIGNYVAGFSDFPGASYNVAAIWKNNVMSLLAFNKEGSVTSGIFIDGTDIYVCGSAIINGNTVPIYWKNKIWHPFTHNFDNGQPVQGTASSIAVDKNHNFYMAGTQQLTFSGGFVPGSWKDANFTQLNLSLAFAPNPIAVDSVQNVFVGDASGSLPAAYTKNGHRILITAGRGPVNGIALSGSDVYATGFLATPPPGGGETGAYFKNSAPVTLQGDNPVPLAITVVKH